MRTFRLFVLSLAAALPLTAAAAKVKPPSAVLREATTNIALVEFAEAGVPGRMVFRRLEQLAGDAPVPELIDLAVPDKLAGIVVPGERYLIAYTPFRREAEQIRVNRGGSQLLVSPGLEPALLRDSAENRAIYAWQPGDDAAAVRKRLPELLQLLQHRDPQINNFALSEIVLRPQLGEALDGAARKLLRRYAEDEDADTNARARLLQAAAVLPEQFGDGKSGWTAIAAALIARQPVQVQQNQSDGHASLVRFAFDIVERDQLRLPQPQLERWLAGDNATLAEKALLLLRRDYAKAEDAALERALQRSLLPAAMREFLLDHRRRLQLQAAQPPAAK